MRKLNCVLLIDDDKITNFINSNLIKKINVSNQIEVRINGDDGIKFIQEYAERNNDVGPELIFLDLNMPVADGFEFLKMYKDLDLHNKKNIDIIVLTTSSHLQDMNLLKETKVKHVNKPLTEKKLSQIISDFKKARVN